jgi:hypothetical protein
MTAISELLNRVPIHIDVTRDHDNLDDSITFYFTDGYAIKFYHEPDCCEQVYIEDIVGDFNNLLLHPILKAEEKSSSYDPDDSSTNISNIDYIESATWTFYTFAGPKGYVDVRWCGESNGYYSEEVGFEQFKYELSDLPSDLLETLREAHIELFI